MADLEKNIIGAVCNVVGRKLLTVAYKDTFSRGDLTKNKDDAVHVLAHELHLRFAGPEDLFVSWENVEGCEQYSLGGKDASFMNKDADVSLYEMTDSKPWSTVIQKNVTGFKVFGHSEYARSETYDGNETRFKFQNQPHMLELVFSNQVSLFFANFYFNDNFDPNSEIGDDLRIVFDLKLANKFIEKFDFKILST